MFAAFLIYLKNSYSMTQYPLVSEYISTILSVEKHFNQLSCLCPVIHEDGSPVMIISKYSVLFMMQDPRNEKYYAVKCFTKDQLGRADAYKQIEEELSRVRPLYFTKIQYLENEIFVDSCQTEETKFPVLLMDWVEGMTLNKYIQKHIHNRYDMEMLAYRFSRLVNWLLPWHFAHGDLTPDNILVCEDGSLMLVDYDNMYVPAMKGQKTREMISPNFRHPNITDKDFNENIDDFPATSILLSLMAIAHNPEWFSRYRSANSLLLCESDYKNIKECQLIQSVLTTNNNNLHKALNIFLLAFEGFSFSDSLYGTVLFPLPQKMSAAPQTSISTTCDKNNYNVGFDIEPIYYSNDGSRLLFIGEFGYREYFVEEGTKVICDRAFSSFYSYRLRYVGIPDSVTHIGDYAFDHCENLRSLEIPRSVIHIGVNPFTYCHQLEDFVCHSPHFVYDNHLLLTYDKTILLACVSYCDLQCDYAIDSSIKIPDSVVRIEESAFEGCRLETIEFSKNLKHIGDRAFAETSISSITIPNVVVHIGNFVFASRRDQRYNCLNYVSIPSSVTSIGVNPFMGCSKLERVECESDHYEVIGQLLIDKDKTAIVSCFSRESCVEIPNGITHIGDYAFAECRELKAVVIPETVIHIGNAAFYGCDSLEELKIPNGVSFLGDKAFECCIKLKAINIPINISRIGDSMFNCCKCLEMIEIPNGATYIGDSAFACCSSLKSIIIPNSISFIGKQAFYDCESLESVVIPSSVTNIGAMAFEGCLNLKHVKIPKSVSEIGRYAFMSCKTVDISDIVDTLSEKAIFEGLLGDPDATCIKKVIIPKGSKSRFLSFENYRDLLWQYTIEFEERDADDHTVDIDLQ